MSTKILNWAAVQEDSEFADSLTVVIQGTRHSKTASWEVAADAVAQLCASTLPRRVQVRRLTKLIAQLDINIEEMRMLSCEVSRMSLQARNLFTAVFPGAELSPHSVHVEAAPLKVEIPARPDGGATETVQTEFEVPTSGTVLILALNEIHTASKKLLEVAGIASIHIQSKEILDRHLDAINDVCAVLIDKSFLKSIEEEEQRELFQCLGCYSSLMWIRIDDDGLKIPLSTVERILQNTSCRSEISINSVSFVPSGILRESELHRITRARNLVSSSDRGMVQSADLEAPELRVIMAAAAEFDRDWSADLPQDIRLHAKIVQGGRTNAKIVLARLNDRNIPFVIKVDKRQYIYEEMFRFKSFIERIDPVLQPRVVFHDGYGAIVFRLVEHADQPAQLAPTLEQALGEIKKCDLYQIGSGFQPESTANAIQAVAQKLRRLNTERMPDGCELANYSAPSMSMFEHLETEGMGFGFSDSAVWARRKAKEIYQRFDGQSLVHGDVNLRNILLLGPENASLIDYANSGPGHPAIDLVRLEAALLFGSFTMCVDLTTFRMLQEYLTIQMLNAEEILLRIPDAFRMSLNRTVLRGCVAARDAAIEVLGDYGGSEIDYRATKMLISWVSVQTEGLQHVLARETIELLSTSFN